MRVFFSLKGFDLRIGRSRSGSIVPGMIMSGILGKFGDDGVDSLPSSSRCSCCCCGWGVAGLVSGGSGQNYLIFWRPASRRRADRGLGLKRWSGEFSAPLLQSAFALLAMGKSSIEICRNNPGSPLLFSVVQLVSFN